MLNNNIISHPSQEFFLTNPSNIVAGNINELSRRTIKKCVNINSAFRDIEAPTLYPEIKCPRESKWSSSNFYIRLPTPIDKTVSMSLSSIEIPNSFYSISSDFKSNVFTIILKKISDMTEISYVIEIIQGNYTATQLIQQIQYAIDNIIGLPGLIKIDMHPIYGKTYIYKNFSHNNFADYDFELDFRLPDDKERNIKMNLGWILGYRKPYYYYKIGYKDGCFYDPGYIKNSSISPYLGPEQLESPSVNQNYKESTNCYKKSKIIQPLFEKTFPQGFVSEGLIDINPIKYLFLIVDDFNNNVSDQYISLVSKTTQLPSSNILARIVVPNSNCNTKCDVMFDNLSNFTLKKRDYFAGVTIEKLHFKLVDEYGRIINLNKNDISLLLEFEVIYNL